MIVSSRPVKLHTPRSVKQEGLTKSRKLLKFSTDISGVTSRNETGIDVSLGKYEEFNVGLKTNVQW